MTAAPQPPRPPHRMLGLLLSRRFWFVVGAVVVAALAVYALVAIPIGPRPFTFSLSTSACDCEHSASTQFSFPDRAYVDLHFSSRYVGALSEYILVVTDPSGTQIVYANMNGGTYGTINWANTTETFTTSHGGTFGFELIAAYPTELPAISAWFNGTYNSPALS